METGIEIATCNRNQERKSMSGPKMADPPLLDWVVPKMPEDTNSCKEDGAQFRR